jgi:hypothetical protein
MKLIDILCKNCRPKYCKIMKEKSRNGGIASGITKRKIARESRKKIKENAINNFIENK